MTIPIHLDAKSIVWTDKDSAGNCFILICSYLFSEVSQHFLILELISSPFAYQVNTTYLFGFILFTYFTFDNYRGVFWFLNILLNYILITFSSEIYDLNTLFSESEYSSSSLYAICNISFFFFFSICLDAQNTRLHR